MFKLTTGSVYAKPFHLSFHLILITIFKNSIAIKLKATAVCFQLPPKYQVLLKARFHPSSPFWISSSILYLHIFRSVLKNMEAHLIEWTAECSGIQEKSIALDKTVTGWPFADIVWAGFHSTNSGCGQNHRFSVSKIEKLQTCISITFKPLGSLPQQKKPRFCRGWGVLVFHPQQRHCTWQSVLFSSSTLRGCPIMGLPDVLGFSYWPLAQQISC